MKLKNIVSLRQMNREYSRFAQIKSFMMFLMYFGMVVIIINKIEIQPKLLKSTFISKRKKRNLQQIPIDLQITSKQTN